MQMSLMDHTTNVTSHTNVTLEIQLQNPSQYSVLTSYHTTNGSELAHSLAPTSHVPELGCF